MPAPFYIKQYHPLMCWHIEYLTPLRLDKTQCVRRSDIWADILSPVPACQNSHTALYLTAGWTNKEACLPILTHMFMTSYIRVYTFACMFCLRIHTSVFVGLCVMKASDLLKLFLSWSCPCLWFHKLHSRYEGAKMLCQHASGLETDTLHFSGLVWYFAPRHLMLNYFR